MGSDQSAEAFPGPSNSLQRLIGNTPLVLVKHLHKNPNVKLYAKLQGQNPGGSVKDRPAFNMIYQALKRGEINKDMKLIEPTSGNTGIALAMIANFFKLDIQLVMPENATKERIQTMRAYGAKVILTPGAKGVEGSRDYALEEVKKGGYKMLDQFNNKDNYMSHYNSTGPQIWRDTKGQITHFVAGVGTYGTIMGVSRYIRERKPELQLIGVHPADGSSIPGIRKWEKEYLPSIFQPERVNSIEQVTAKEAIEMTRRMASQQSIFAGTSSGAAMAQAVKVAQKIQKGVIVVITCDRGDRYLSSPLFDQQKK